MAWLRLKFARGKARTAQPLPPTRVEPEAESEAARVTAFDLERRALQAVNELIDGSEEDKRAWFARTAASDPILATQVAALLQADAKARKALPTELPGTRQPDFVRPPERIGAYRIVERIGGGGMGEVYLGVRDDGLFKHTVAIKVIKQGLFTTQLSRRFAEERRILASLQHPNIAQLFDGGEAASGHSFIVMEHLEGQTITDYVASAKPSLSQVLRLFLDVCSAVQFSHQNLVVHADIKPSNVLVTDKGVVKLVDFGIARAVDPLRADEAAAGQPEPMTRAYAAPERRDGAPPSVSGDVYGLGVLLYELLAGPPPGGEAEGETTPPSRTALTSSRGAGRPRELRGDLDAIVLKAMAPDPTDRYASVVELSGDIERYFRGQPVKARPDTWQYRSWRFMNRHRLGLGLTVTALVTATAAAVGASLLYIDSEQSRALAERRFADTRSLANYLMNDVDAQLAELPGALPLRRELVSKSKAYLEALQQDRFASPALQLDVARGYLRLARIYGLDLTGGLGDFDAARASLKRAKTILSQLAQSEPNDPALLLVEAEAQLTQGSEVFAAPASTDLNENMASLLAARELYTRIGKQNPNNVEASLGRWRAELMYARVLQYMGKPAESAGTARQTLLAYRPTAVSEYERQQSEYFTNGAHLIMAENEEELGQADAALRDFNQAHENIDAMRASGQVGLDSQFLDSTALAGMARLLSVKGDQRAAIERFRQSIDLQNTILASGPNDQVSRNLIYTFASLSKTLAKAGQYAEARVMVRQAIEATRAAISRTPSDKSQRRVLALYLTTAAKIELMAGNQSAACAASSQALLQWNLVQRDHAVLPIDLDARGPIRTLEAHARACAGPP